MNFIIQIGIIITIINFIISILGIWYWIGFFISECIGAIVIIMLLTIADDKNWIDLDDIFDENEDDI